MFSEAIDILKFAGYVGDRAQQLSDDLRRRNSEEYWRSEFRREAKLHTDNVPIEFLREFYGDGHQLGCYTVRIGDATIKTDVYTTQSRVGMHRPIRTIPTRFEPLRPRAPLLASDEHRALLLERYRRRNVNSWNTKKYRLLGSPFEDDHPLELRFCETDYVEYRLGTGLMEEELYHALGANDGRALLRDRDRHLPIRTAIMPDIEAMLSLERRVCAGGPGVLFAIRMPDEPGFHFSVHRRSPNVTDSPNMWALLPKGFHEFWSHPERECSIEHSVIRELHEEAFGGEEDVGRPGDRLVAARDVASPIRDYLEGSNAVEMVLTGLGLNARRGTFDPAVLLIIDDYDFYPRFQEDLKSNWESQEFRWIGTSRREVISAVLQDRRWAAEAIFQLVEGLYSLKSVYPADVDLPPDMCRQVGNTVLS